MKVRWMAGLGLAAWALLGQNAAPYKPTAEELQMLHARADELGAELAQLSAKADPELFADAAVYHKAAVWILRFPEEFYKPDYVRQTQTVIEQGLNRIRELRQGNPAWPRQTGRLARAYRSRLDGSLQPYGLVIPASYRGDHPVRLDVVLHGRAATMNEVSFLASHDSAKPIAADQDFIQLEIFGRTNNAYRWAGEDDVYEAIASVQRRYKIDPNRIALRGFSMGGAGAWHLGLHDPSQWAAVEAGAGFTETENYAKQHDLPPAVKATLTIYDSVDYALNAVDVPFVGYGGQDDPQLQASTNVREQLTREGYAFTPDGLNFRSKDIPVLFLVGPHTMHKFHPDSLRESNAFLAQELARAPRTPDHIRFVAYTPRYGRCFWFTVDALERQYQRAEVDAQRNPRTGDLTILTKNVARLELTSAERPRRITVDGQQVALRGTAVAVEKRNARWEVSPGRDLRKRRGLQGPIDDAFMDSFLCVRPTGKAASQLLQDQTALRMARFEDEYAKYFRADIPQKADTEISDSDIADHNLILFGDPQSNKVLARILPQLPLQWTAKEISLGGQTFSAADHLPVLIYPNPLNPRRYVVLNTGYTMHSPEFQGTNALLFPRLGDYAVLSLQAGNITDRPALIGLFDEAWKIR